VVTSEYCESSRYHIFWLALWLPAGVNINWTEEHPKYYQSSSTQLFSSLPSSLFPLVPLSPTKLDQNDPSHSCSWPTSQPSNHRSPEMMRSFNRSDRVPWTTASDRSNLVQVRPCTHLNVRVNLLQLGWIDHRKLLATHCLYPFSMTLRLRDGWNDDTAETKSNNIGYKTWVLV